MQEQVVKNDVGTADAVELKTETSEHVSLKELEQDVSLDATIKKGDRNNPPKVHPELVSILPIDSKAKLVLEEMVKESRSIANPLIVCELDGEEYLLDGHMRLQVILENDIDDFYIKKIINIKTVEEATVWIIRNLFSNRSLNDVQRTALALKLKEYYKKLAKENQRKGGKRKKALSEKDKVDKWGMIANEANVSRQFAMDVDYVLEHGTAKEKQELEEKGRGASSYKKQIEKRIKDEAKNSRTIAPYVNPKEGRYINRIIQGDCRQVLKDMEFHGIKNVGSLITSFPYGVGMDYSDFSDDLERNEYLDLISESIYLAQRLGRDGMKIILNCTDTFNEKEARKTGDYQHNIAKDIGNIIDRLNAKYDDCDLRYLGSFKWYKNHCNAKALGSIGSPSCPIIRNDSELIMVFYKNTHKLENISGIDCTPKDASIFGDDCRDDYIITNQEYSKWTLGTWDISPCTDKKLLDIHPCPFNEEIPYRLIKLFTYPNDIVLDPFAGIATVCKVASDLKRRYVGIELSHDYCNFGKQRIENSLKAKNITMSDNNHYPMAS